MIWFRKLNRVKDALDKYAYTFHKFKCHDCQHWKYQIIFRNHANVNKYLFCLSDEMKLLLKSINMKNKIESVIFLTWYWYFLIYKMLDLFYFYNLMLFFFSVFTCKLQMYLWGTLSIRQFWQRYSKMFKDVCLSGFGIWSDFEILWF